MDARLGRYLDQFKAPPGWVLARHTPTSEMRPMCFLPTYTCEPGGLPKPRERAAEWSAPSEQELRSAGGAAEEVPQTAGEAAATGEAAGRAVDIAAASALRELDTIEERTETETYGEGVLAGTGVRMQVQCVYCTYHAGAVHELCLVVKGRARESGGDWRTNYHI
eukprot:5364174-Pyramimonas_sp.AAC.1